MFINSKRPCVFNDLTLSFQLFYIDTIFPIWYSDVNSEAISSRICYKSLFCYACIIFHIPLKLGIYVWELKEKTQAFTNFKTKFPVKDCPLTFLYFKHFDNFCFNLWTSFRNSALKSWNGIWDSECKSFYYLAGRTIVSHSLLLNISLIIVLVQFFWVIDWLTPFCSSNIL